MSSPASANLMLNLKRVARLFSRLIIAGSAAFLMFVLTSNSAFAASDASVSSSNDISQITTFAWTPRSFGNLSQQAKSTQDDDPRECRKLLGIYIEDPKWDPVNKEWSCCRYDDGDPDCPPPRE